MSRVHIFNDGKPGYMTTITDEETGQMISDHITEVTIKATDVMPVATITVFAPVIDIIADAEIRNVCPCCGQPSSKKALVEELINQYLALNPDANILRIKPEAKS